MEIGFVDQILYSVLLSYLCRVEISNQCIIFCDHSKENLANASLAVWWVFHVAVVHPFIFQLHVANGEGHVILLRIPCELNVLEALQLQVNDLQAECDECLLAAVLALPVRPVHGEQLVVHLVAGVEGAGQAGIRAIESGDSGRHGDLHGQ